MPQHDMYSTTAVKLFDDFASMDGDDELLKIKKFVLIKKKNLDYNFI